MVKFIFKCILTFLAVVAVYVLYNHDKMTVMALSRVDPLPQTKALVAEKRFAEAESYLEFFMEHEYVNSNQEAVDLYNMIQETRDGWIYQMKKLGEGIIKGKSDEKIGQITGVVSDFLVIGDIRDLGVQGWNYVQGEEVDEVLVALSAIGVAATGAQIASVASTAASAGTTAPAVAGSTSAKTAIVTLKVAQKLDKLPKWMLKGIKEAAVAVKKSKSIKQLTTLFDDVAGLAKVKGGLELLSKTEDALSLKKMANFASDFKHQSLAVFRLGGDKIIDVSEKIKDTKAIKTAVTFGEKGVATLDKMGAKKFLQTVSNVKIVRGSKIVYKNGMGWVYNALSLIPKFILYLLIVSGISVWLPIRSWYSALQQKTRNSEKTVVEIAET